MRINVQCSDVIGRLLIHVFAMIEAVAVGYKPEDLQFEMDYGSTALRGTGGMARVHYWANLPTRPDGAFDMERVPETVRQNLEAIGTQTVNGIIYQDIVDRTLRNERPITEPELRAARMMKAGSSQRAVQQLFHGGLISRAPIAAAVSAEPSAKHS